MGTDFCKQQARSKSPAPRARAVGKSPARSPSPAAKPRAAGKAGKDAQVLRLLALISQKVLIKLFCKSQFTHKFVTLLFFFVSVTKKIWSASIRI